MATCTNVRRCRPVWAPEAAAAEMSRPFPNSRLRPSHPARRSYHCRQRSGRTCDLRRPAQASRGPPCPRMRACRGDCLPRTSKPSTTKGEPSAAPAIESRCSSPRLGARRDMDAAPERGSVVPSHHYQLRMHLRILRHGDGRIGSARVSAATATKGVSPDRLDTRWSPGSESGLFVGPCIARRVDPQPDQEHFCRKAAAAAHPGRRRVDHPIHPGV